MNVDLIRSYPDLSGFLKDQPDNTYQGTHYGIPQAWGANLLMWRPDVVQPDPDSWGVVFDPVSPYRGEVTAADDPFSIAAAALYLKATQPDLGITDVYELTPCSSRRPSPSRGCSAGSSASTGPIPRSSSAVGRRRGRGRQRLAGVGERDQRRSDRERAGEGDRPEGGGDRLVDDLDGVLEGRNPNCMYLWMDFITRPPIQAQVATTVGEAPANPKACDVIATTDPAFCGTFHVGDAAFAARLEFAKLPMADCGDDRGATCTPTTPGGGRGPRCRGLTGSCSVMSHRSERA